MVSFEVVDEQLTDASEFETNLHASLCIGSTLEARFVTSYIPKMKVSL
jgi:hypothetical protein